MLIYHYTKIDAAINIIKGGLCFRGYRYDSMNDPTDFIFARDLIIPKIISQLHENEDVFEVFPYIVSFCKKRDYDIMWRLYQGEVALVIDTDRFPKEEWQRPGNLSDNIGYNNVMYATEETIEDVAKELYDNRIGIFEEEPLLEYQLYVTPFIKHEAYKIENEFRLTQIDYNSFKMNFNPEDPKNPLVYEDEICKDIQFGGVKDGLIRFYKEFNLPKECLVGIILHTFDEEKFNLQKKHFEMWLAQHGFYPQNISIEKTSSYPIR